MTSVLVRAAALAVRAWTTFYTWDLPPQVRDARRADVSSDVWQSTHDPDVRSDAMLALQLVSRLLLGMPDDLFWRFEQPHARKALIRFVAAAGVCSVLVLAVVREWWATSVPALPAPVVTRAHHAAESPPPPPPPPPPPGHTMVGAVTPAYARTTYTVRSDGVVPERLKEVRPVYPPIAMAFDLEGAVVVEARITEAGQVADARVVERAAMVLSRSAIQAVQQWAFAPSDPRSAPARHRLTVRVEFARQQ